MPPRAKKTALHDRSSASNNNSQGLAAPGRRIAKQKSNSQLDAPQSPASGQFRPSVLVSHQNGSPSANSAANVSPIPVKTTPSTTSVDAVDASTRAAVNAHTHYSSNKDGNENVVDAKQYGGSSGSGSCGHTESGRPRVMSVASEDDWEGGRQTSHSVSSAGPPLRIGVNGVSKTPAKHRLSPFALTKTILTSCPLWDVIAILIILLQLPPAIISVIHFLFVALTFVTPSSTSLSNLPGLYDILLGSVGAPSLPVTISLDILAFIVFCMINVPMQNLGLEIAQAIIAIFLGGAAASRGETMRSMLWCLVVILGANLTRARPFKQLGSSFFWSGILGSSDLADAQEFPNRWNIKPGWPRSILAVHILVQGLARIVRRYLLWRDAESSAGSLLKKSDSDLNGGTTSLSSRAATQQHDSEEGVGAVNMSGDGRSPGQPPAGRDAKDRTFNSRRKRRQATQVRSQQPFWAALASTKVTFVKEYEQSQASVDSLEANATDLTRLGNAGFKPAAEQVLLREVGAFEVSFGLAIRSSAGPSEDVTTSATNGSVSDGRRLVKPRNFSVRVNGASWGSLKAERFENKEGYFDDDIHVWLGKIYGLTAYSPYHIEFIRQPEDTVIYAVSLVTSPASAAEQGRLSRLGGAAHVESIKSAISGGSSQALQPPSPGTTLRNSLIMAEADLEALRNRNKRNRKEHKATLTSIQKEVESLNSRIHTGGGSDDRFRARIKQLEQSIRRADEEAETTAVDASKLGDVPQGELRQWTSKKAAVRKERQQHDAAMSTFEAGKAQADERLDKAKNELGAVQLKHQKSQQRQVKFSERQQGLAAEKTQAQEDKMRRALSRSTLLEQQAEDEQKFLSFITGYQAEAQAEQIKANQLRAQIKHLEDLFGKVQAAHQHHHQQQQQHHIQAHHHQSVPQTPEVSIAGIASNRNSYPIGGLQYTANGIPIDPHLYGANNSGSQRLGNQSPMFYAGSSSSGHQHYHHHHQRDRSSSLLSGTSNFTDPMVEHPLNNPTTTNTNGASASSSSNTGPIAPPITAPIFSPASLAGLPAGVFNDRRKSSQGSGSLRGSASGSSSAGSGNWDPASPAGRVSGDGTGMGRVP